MSLEILPVSGLPEVRPGDDLASLLIAGLEASGLTPADGDVLVVTQKVVSKAEGRVVPVGEGGKAAWVARETRRIVARRGDLVIAETRHGFVCANAGVDASNVDDGFLTLLPVDPDASADALRSAVEAATGARVAVVITDTFGRPWRQGLVNVAIGCSGLPALIDLRGTKDAKAEGIPAAIVRGVRAEGPPLPATALIRPPEEDLFPYSPVSDHLDAARPTGDAR